MIKVYNALITDFTQADYANMYSLLDCAIKAKIDAKKSENDKKRSLAGLILLWRGAGELYGKTDFSITFNKHGKPFCDFCFFSISHSDDRVVCVFDDVPIGVDIQKIHTVKPREKYRFFNREETFYVNQTEDMVDKRYTEIFTKKEAAVKLLGLSIANAADINTFSKEFDFKTQDENGFVFSICRANAQMM